MIPCRASCGRWRRGLPVPGSDRRRVAPLRGTPPAERQLRPVGGRAMLDRIEQIRFGAAQLFVDEAALLQAQGGPVELASERLRQMGTQEPGRLGEVREHGAKQMVVRLGYVASHDLQSEQEGAERQGKHGTVSLRRDIFAPPSSTRPCCLRDVQAFEASRREGDEVPKASVSVSVSLDGMMVQTKGQCLVKNAVPQAGAPVPQCTLRCPVRRVSVMAEVISGKLQGIVGYDTGLAQASRPYSLVTGLRPAVGKMPALPGRPGQRPSRICFHDKHERVS